MLECFLDAHHGVDSFTCTIVPTSEYFFLGKDIVKFG